MAPIYDKPSLSTVYQNRTLTGAKIETSSAVKYIEESYQTKPLTQEKGSLVDIYV